MVIFLKEAGHIVNRKRVQRLMREMGLVAMAPGPNTSRPHPEHKVWDWSNPLYTFRSWSSFRSLHERRYLAGHGPQGRSSFPRSQWECSPRRSSGASWSLSTTLGLMRTPRSAVVLLTGRDRSVSGVKPLAAPPLR
jgi:hypothetical protein